VDTGFFDSKLQNVEDFRTFLFKRAKSQESRAKSKEQRAKNKPACRTGREQRTYTVNFACQVIKRSAINPTQSRSDGRYMSVLFQQHAARKSISGRFVSTQGNKKKCS
jgi:hypothetical protein